MGSVIYEFLTESFLFDKSLQDENFKSIPEPELKRELETYRQYALSSLGELGNEIQENSSRLKIFGSQDYFSIKHLMQTALYLDQIILPDPIFALSREPSDISNSMGKFLGMHRKEGIDRRVLSSAASRMKVLTPMVAADYVKFFPTTYYIEPGDYIPFTFSNNGFSDVLPSEIIAKYRESADVKSLRKVDNGLVVENALKRGREIAVQFSGDDEEKVYIYQLLAQEVTKMDEETRTVHFRMTLPDAPPSVDEFNAWINQSINQSARGHYEQLLKGLMLSSNFGASYLTSSRFTHSLLGSSNSSANIQSYASDCILNLELPFLDGVEMHDLMSVRNSDGEAFKVFRNELESRFGELRLETDSEIFNVKLQNMIHELNDVQVTKIDQKVRALKKGAFSNAVIAVGGLAGSVVTSGWSIAATLIALANGYQSYSTYREKAQENPSYFLWQVKNF